ncbi:nucleotidyltransferase family protein [Paenibacillus sp. FJAT-26967]|uniref:nucleotidyltransferase family protein n=1 Tax=Paenibacillus sp. FJAT-26967 TaxID=1729690 RepID=UPI0008383F00|nr:nucleotidyltransferase family protein [Paenibacillus sp. FJAT-26967]
MQQCEWTIEQQTVLLLGSITVTDENLERARTFFAVKNFDHAVWISYLLDHKLALITFWNIKKYKLEGLIPGKWRHILDLYFQSNQYRNERMMEELSSVLEALYNADVRCVLLKGSMLRYTVYPDIGLRYSNDIDLLIPENDLTKAAEIISSLQFIQGHYKLDEKIIVPASRQQIMLKRMTTHELVPFLKEIKKPFCEFIELDVHFDIFSRSKNLQHAFPIKELFENAELRFIGEQHVPCYTLSPTHNLLQLASHAYQDAALMQGILNRKDNELIKYVDIYESVLLNKGSIDWVQFAADLLEGQVNHVFYYVAYHVELLFGEIFPASFMEAIRPERLDYLNQYAQEEAEPVQWKTSFMERLFDRSRIDEVFQVFQVDRERFAESNKFFGVFEGQFR